MVGEKVTLARQLAPAVSVVEQFVLTEYCPEPVTAVMLTVVLPVFES